MEREKRQLLARRCQLATRPRLFPSKFRCLEGAAFSCSPRSGYLFVAPNLVERGSADGLTLADLFNAENLSRALMIARDTTVQFPLQLHPRTSTEPLRPTPGGARC